MRLGSVLAWYWSGFGLVIARVDCVWVGWNCFAKGMVILAMWSNLLSGFGGSLLGALVTVGCFFGRSWQQDRRDRMSYNRDSVIDVASAYMQHCEDLFKAERIRLCDWVNSEMWGYDDGPFNLKLQRLSDSAREAVDEDRNTLKLRCPRAVEEIEALYDAAGGMSAEKDVERREADVMGDGSIEPAPCLTDAAIQRYQEAKSAFREKIMTLSGL